jgi:hypothetical protein
MKLMATVMLTLDGVYQGPGGPTKTGAAGSSAADGRTSRGRCRRG